MEWLRVQFWDVIVGVGVVAVAIPVYIIRDRMRIRRWRRR